MLDEVLLKDIRAGEQEALYTLYTKYRTKFIGTLVKKYNCDAALATEIYRIAVIIVHENILSEKLSNLNNENSLWNYLYTTGTNKYKEWLREQQKTVESPEDHFNVLIVEDNDYELQDRMIREENQMVDLNNMQEALASLGDPCTRLLELFYYEKKSMTEIAEILNYNNSTTTRKQKYKCLKRLQKAFHKKSKNT